MCEEGEVNLSKHPSKDNEKESDIYYKLPYILLIWKHPMI